MEITEHKSNLFVGKEATKAKSEYERNIRLDKM